MSIFKLAGEPISKFHGTAFGCTILICTIEFDYGCIVRADRWRQENFDKRERPWRVHIRMEQNIHENKLSWPFLSQEASCHSELRYSYNTINDVTLKHEDLWFEQESLKSTNEAESETEPPRIAPNCCIACYKTSSLQNMALNYCESSRFWRKPPYHNILCLWIKSEIF